MLLCLFAAAQATGGYKEWPLLEDLDLVQRLRQVRRTC